MKNIFGIFLLCLLVCGCSNTVHISRDPPETLFESTYSPAPPTLQCLRADSNQTETNKDGKEKKSVLGLVWGGIAKSGKFLLDGTVHTSRAIWEGTTYASNAFWDGTTYVSEAFYDGTIYTAESLRDGTVATFDALEEAAPSKETVGKVVAGALLVGLVVGDAYLKAKYSQPSGSYYPPAVYNQGQSSSTNSGTKVYSGPKKCSFKTDCDVGFSCIKIGYQLEGFCAKAVDEYGIPTFEEPTIGDDGSCSFNTDCPIGFRCYKPGGSLYGVCVK